MRSISSHSWPGTCCGGGVGVGDGGGVGVAVGFGAPFVWSIFRFRAVWVCSMALSCSLTAGVGFDVWVMESALQATVASKAAAVSIIVRLIFISQQPCGNFSLDLALGFVLGRGTSSVLDDCEIKIRISSHCCESAACLMRRGESRLRPWGTPLDNLLAYRLTQFPALAALEVGRRLGPAVAVRSGLPLWEMLVLTFI